MVDEGGRVTTHVRIDRDSFVYVADPDAPFSQGATFSLGAPDPLT